MANIRLNVAKCITPIIHVLKSNKDIEEKAKAIVKQLMTDKDVDVQYYAKKASTYF